MSKETPKKAELDSTVTEIRPATLEDLPGLKPILEQWIRVPGTGELIEDEVAETLQEIHNRIEGENDKIFLVAHAPDGTVQGVMGLQEPGEVMQQFTATDNPGEIINAYVDGATRGQGVGRELVKVIEQTARDFGVTEIVLNSGPRYQETGWPFWRAVYGEPVAIATDYYGETFDAPVWRTVL